MTINHEAVRLQIDRMYKTHEELVSKGMSQAPVSTGTYLNIIHIVEMLHNMLVSSEGRVAILEAALLAANGRKPQ